MNFSTVRKSEHELRNDYTVLAIVLATVLASVKCVDKSNTYISMSEDEFHTHEEC